MEELRIIIRLRLDLLASRLGRTEASPVVAGSDITQAEDRTSTPRDSPGLCHSNINKLFKLLDV